MPGRLPLIPGSPLLANEPDAMQGRNLGIFDQLSLQDGAFVDLIEVVAKVDVDVVVAVFGRPLLTPPVQVRNPSCHETDQTSCRQNTDPMTDTPRVAQFNLTKHLIRQH